MQKLMLFFSALIPLAGVLQAASEEMDIFTLNQKIGRGVNIIGYDPIWRSPQQARFKEPYFKMLKEAGFSSVRINLHPFRFMRDEPPYSLDPQWLGTLRWAVEKSLDAGLVAILDLHEYNAMGSDPAAHRAKFLAFWEQISAEFATAPPTVLFEILNEPNRQLTEELWNEYFREALAVIRKSHPTRGVIIGPAHYNSVDALPSLQLPEDDRKLIVTVHYYKPMEFTHQGARWTPAYADKTGIIWPRSAADEEAVVEDFRKVKEWAQKNNRPIFLGEFGAYDKADMDSRVRYISFVARTAEKCGFSWAYWQFDSDFILYDVVNEKWVQPIYNALIP
ncbi:MAG: glycoside hydrolase family 5 protein [Anaerohalosphaeraceae bacterium]